MVLNEIIQGDYIEIVSQSQVRRGGAKQRLKRRTNEVKEKNEKKEAKKKYVILKSGDQLSQKLLLGQVTEDKNMDC